ncbi:MAG: HEAT repeat domain-containing protein [Candidatus Thorarchaeota archaeon]|nr:HEAT repeat domain-containing protein [Candidatus Thorarchaeota archaeon]
MVDELLREIKSEDQQVVLNAIDRLGILPDSDATSALTACLKDPRYMVRLFAAVQLGERKDPSAIPSLIESLHDSSLFVRQTAAGALENIGGPKALAAVKKAEAEGLLLDELPDGIILGPV